MASFPSLRPEIGTDGLPREAPVIAYTEKAFLVSIFVQWLRLFPIIEEEQLLWKKVQSLLHSLVRFLLYKQKNYSKIRDVEKELANLSMEMKLTAGPKKAALELFRKKIETSTEKVRIAKQREEQARKVRETACQTLKEEEKLKQKLCDDLTNLVQESGNSQFVRLEELRRRLAALNPSRASPISAHNGILMEPIQDGAAVVNASSVPLEPVGANETKPNQMGSGILLNGPNYHPSVEGEEKGESPGVPKGRGSSGPGWTGAGFDVDGRS